MSAPTYVRRDSPVEAMHFASNDDITPIINWLLDLPGVTARWIDGVAPSHIAIDSLGRTRYYVLQGDWIIRLPEGKFRILTDELFQYEYEIAGH